MLQATQSNLDTVKSALAEALSKARSFAEQYDDKSAYLEAQVKFLQETKEKQSSEIKGLEEELSNTVCNLKTLNDKYLLERESNLKMSQSNTLTIDKLRNDVLESKAMLETARIEYGTLVRKHKSLMKKVQEVEPITFQTVFMSFIFHDFITFFVTVCTRCEPSDE